MSDSFIYIKIPANGSQPIEELKASKASGLEKDELVANAKAYFAKQNPEEPSQVEHQFPNLGPSCDIMALTIPMEGNSYQAVSLYASDNFSDASTMQNDRATQLVTACGHTLPQPIRGDIFVGRAEDIEVSDVWQRREFIAADADPKAEWCRTARSQGGEGGQGTAGAWSLSNILWQQFSKNATAIADAKPVSQGMYGTNGTAAGEK
ncbi:MAG: hypothetical protein SGILL_007354 [Bacillariaceae sp.]